ncbi:WD40 repeat-like protein [Pholiota conissans]|uniref:WD40 repeat-like protein n=1 Tax=Pholiota conissans TaxID=109636 RepID=A0A9P5YZA2_9AGAR|nr:WD40 repeat-like protein [Pholiota conissans]
MFATTTTDALCIADAALLKQTPSSLPLCLDLLDTPIASAWSPDNSSLFISSLHGIQRYEPASNTLRIVHTHEETNDIASLVAKDPTSIIFSAGSKVCVLDSDQISQTFESHKVLVNSLSLSNDNTLLASSSTGAIHVHNLTLGSHTVMRGLNSVEISSCIFHPHSRTRLLVAAGSQLLVFDTTRPSGPMKTISITGNITSVACSPFSKTLVAVATSEGYVGLIDLEKEKALFRTLNVKVELTTLGFSPEGAVIYLGTATGKILVVDLRALDKPPKSITISENGSRIQTISIQKKSKNPTAKTPVTAATKKTPAEATRRTASKPAPSPTRKPSLPTSPIARRPMSSNSPTKRAATEPKKVLSPKRDPHGNSGHPRELAGKLDELASLRRGKSSTTPVTKPTLSSVNPRRTSTSTSAPPSRKPSSAGSALSSSKARISPEIVVTSGSATSTSRPSSSASRISRTTTTTQESSPVQSRLRAGSTVTRASQTPSPDLPDPQLEPVTPDAASKQRKKGMSVLGLGTPEVDRWIRLGNEDERKPCGKGTGKGKTVGFQDEGDSEDENARERNRILSMQISPRRPIIPSGASESAESWAASPALDAGASASPLASGSGTAGGASAHNLLRTIVQDVMFDFQRETKAEMMGLHLDLLKMGRSWKAELRTLMDEYVGDLRDLREENQRLRLENERLKRSF